MANIKITELNGITKKASDDVLPIVDVSANETKKIAVEDLLDKNVELIAVSDTEPAECSYGDKYYNTEDNLIYTAIANDTWGEDGEEPIEGIFYVVFGEQSSYAYNGTTLVSVGGGTEDIIISDTQPTSEDWKLWIDKGEIGSQASEIVNEYSESTGLGYSANYVNKLHTYSETEQRVGTWIDGKPVYRRSFQVSKTAAGQVTIMTIDNLDVIVSLQTYLKRTDTYRSINNWGQQSTDYGTSYVSSNILRFDSNYTGTLYGTVEYTKTTD